MSLMEQSQRTVYRIRPTIVLDGRDEVRNYVVPPAARDEATVIVQPTTGREDQFGGRDATLAQFNVIHEDAEPGWWKDDDLLEMDGDRYQIEGHVQDWPEPLPHAYFLINRWEG